MLRKRAEHEIDDCYFASLSARTITYKGMLTSHQLAEFFPDLSDERVISGLALVHSRFSTNTFPSWPLAHPYRYLAHNGEINTLAGNRNWMRAREALCATDLIPGLERAFPIVTPGASDSASFDEVLELLHLGGRPLHHAVLMMIPEAWENHRTMDPARRAFYRYHAVADGAVGRPGRGGLHRRHGDRRRPRPQRPPAGPVLGHRRRTGGAGQRGRRPRRARRPRWCARAGSSPGGCSWWTPRRAGSSTTTRSRTRLAAEQPYAEWLDDGQIDLEDLPPRTMLTPQHASVVGRQRLFGYTNEELRLILEPMARTGSRADRLDGHRHGHRRALRPAPAALRLLHPAVRPGHQPAAGRHPRGAGHLADVHPRPRGQPARAHRRLVPPDRPAHAGHRQRRPGQAALRQRGREHARLPRLRHRRAVRGGRRGRGPAGRHRGRAGPGQRGHRRRAPTSSCSPTATRRPTLAPIPSLLLVSAVHHHLVRDKTRTRVGLVVESGDAREVHHMALLKGFGAAAINPYLAFETIDDMIASGILTGVTPRQAQRNYIKAASKGIIKVMSKMGISTVASYTGAQVFEAVGLAADVVDEYFTGTVSRIGGVGLDVLAEEVASRHRLSHLDRPTELAHREREVGGEYQWRREGEIHLFNPKTVFKLQHATRSKRYEVFKEYTKAVDDQSAHLATLRGLMRLRTGALPAVPIDEVEPASAILARFSTGAMSYGSISAEAHETLAIAMNRLGGRSNTGEGGEDADRFTPDANGDLRRSAIKQVASGRFGVTSEYLVNADDIQIKIAQGAKPGEGGQLAGHKVYPWIAKTRFSTPGVGLISPPPHHDIYSIEDIAQLIHDLKSANPRARVHVKLVAEVGVGTVAAGVAKAHSDVVLISGHDGGTGATPLTSQKHAGIPWELGLAETQQTLLANDLRDRIVVQVDGQMKTGRDVVIGALLGAEEFGFATAPLVVSGCIMMRVCHLDTCPVGIATQNPTLRARYSGTPEFVETFFEYIAEEVREYLAALGLRSLEEAIGRVDLHRRRRGRRPLEGRRASTWRPSWSSPSCPRAPCATASTSRTTGSTGPSTTPSSRPCRPAIEDGHAGQGRAGRHQREPHGGHPARLRDHPAPRRGGAARGDHRPHLPRLGRAELRRLRAQGGDHAAAGRRQRLPGQGAVRRPDHRPPARGRRRSPPRTTSWPAT